MGQVKVSLEIRRFQSLRRAMDRAVRMTGATVLEEPHAYCSEERAIWADQERLLALLVQSQ